MMNLGFARPRLHGFSPEVEAVIVGRLINDHQIASKAAFARLFFPRLGNSPRTQGH
jgi:hypothetical protein